MLDQLVELKAKHGEVMDCPCTLDCHPEFQQMLGPHAMRLRSRHTALGRRLASQACCLDWQIVSSSLQTQFLPVFTCLCCRSRRTG